MRLLIIQPGQKLEALADVGGDFFDWMLAGMGWPASKAHCIRPHTGDALPACHTVDAVLLTGSGAMVTDGDPWIEATAAWLRDLVACGRPVLGVCFGHQLLAHALGGVVADNPNGIEVGTVETRPTAAARADKLFSALPIPCPVQASHRQSVVALPPGAIRLSASRMDPNHAFRFREFAWGVQFHPEFDHRIVAEYINWYRNPLLSQGVDVDVLRSRVRPTPLAATVLARFARMLETDSDR